MTPIAEIRDEIHEWSDKIVKDLARQPISDSSVIRDLHILIASVVDMTFEVVNQTSDFANGDATFSLLVAARDAIYSAFPARVE